MTTSAAVALLLCWATVASGDAHGASSSPRNDTYAPMLTQAPVLALSSSPSNLAGSGPDAGRDHERHLWQLSSARPTASDIPSTIFIAADADDFAGCGSLTAPCGTLRYAVVVVAASIVPVDDVVTIIVAAGQYDHRSCGGVAWRPLDIQGAGSSVTTVDCGGSGRLLFSNSSVAVGGLTVSHGAVTVVSPGDDSGSGYGGGAVSVAWASPEHTGLSAVFRDVRFVDNVVTATSGGEYTGGGAVSVFSVGSASHNRMTFDGCDFERNQVVCGGTGACSATGGAAFVMFLAAGSSSLDNNAVLFNNVTVRDNVSGT